MSRARVVPAIFARRLMGPDGNGDRVVETLKSSCGCVRIEVDSKVIKIFLLQSLLEKSFGLLSAYIIDQLKQTLFFCASFFFLFSGRSCGFFFTLETF